MDDVATHVGLVASIITIARLLWSVLCRIGYFLVEATQDLAIVKVSISYSSERKESY